MMKGRELDLLIYYTQYDYDNRAQQPHHQVQETDQVTSYKEIIKTDKNTRLSYMQLE